MFHEFVVKLFNNTRNLFLNNGCVVIYDVVGMNE